MNVCTKKKEGRSSSLDFFELIKMAIETLCDIQKVGGLENALKNLSQIDANIMESSLLLSLGVVNDYVITPYEMGFGNAELVKCVLDVIPAWIPKENFPSMQIYWKLIENKDATPEEFKAYIDSKGEEMNRFSRNLGMEATYIPIDLF